MRCFNEIFCTQKMKSGKPDEIQNARILDEIKSTICLSGFHHEVISSEFYEDFTLRQVDLIEKSVPCGTDFSGRSVDNGFIFQKT
ncbi:MAG: hypothetical protein E7517_02435 [Ruminococcaceae bacterium]|nr:hypothetical protein [Oscillospiraceae bacterium]